MTDVLATLERLMKEATPGAVFVDYDKKGYPILRPESHPSDDYLPIARFVGPLPTDRRDAHFYVALRNAAPALLELAKAAERAERKLAAYVGVCKGDKELTDAVLPMLRTALRNLNKVTL